ncbi:MAG: photosynthetic protein synthase I [Legionellales bacterium RIFCSPHIGHO2_12_FULL_35_11]|nr:MAG: photosynthetic protein synthase I [Legionellales bacterium RIFCSPHIGHO2_12_FULL_35_11]
MEVRTNGIKKTVIGLIALAALAAGSYFAQIILSKENKSNNTNSYSFDKSLFKGTLLDSPRSVVQFSLIGVDNQPFNNLSLTGQWTLVFFGFTNCGYMCPTTMAMLGNTYRLLEKNGAQTLPKVVMITLDPQRDSLERLGNYVKAFDQHFYGARGDEEAIKSLTKDLGIAYANIAPEELGKQKQDNIEHTGAIMLFNPAGQLTAFFTTPHNAGDIAADFLLLSKKRD